MESILRQHSRANGPVENLDGNLFLLHVFFLIYVEFYIHGLFLQVLLNNEKEWGVAYFHKYVENVYLQQLAFNSFVNVFELSL